MVLREGGIYIITLGVGWLALLIFTKGQCEGLNLGIGAEEQTPTSFFISKTLLNLLMLNLGVHKHIKTSNYYGE